MCNSCSLVRFIFNNSKQIFVFAVFVLRYKKYTPRVLLMEVNLPNVVDSHHSKVLR